MKLRVRSTKLGKVRFTSHRDAARMWERGFRRAELPLATTEGFTPRPKISFGLALPTAGESIAEYTDIELVRDFDPADLDLDDLPRRLSAALPRGFDVVSAAVLTEKGSLQQLVTSSTWELWHPSLTRDDHQRALRLLDEPELMFERVRKGKTRRDDVRPMILDLRAADNSTSQPYTNLALDDRFVIELATLGSALRPSELAELAFPNHDARDVRVLRTHQWITDEQGRREVLQQHAPPHAVDTSPNEALV